MNYVIYHKDCADGFCAAWLLARNLDIPYENCFSCNYGDPSPGMLRLIPHECDTLYVADFSFPSNILCDLASRFKHVYVYDHHETAITALRTCVADNLTLVLDLKRCGARITYDELNLCDEKERRVVNYVQDRDLWQWRLPYSREISAYFGLELNFQRWNNIVGETDIVWREKGGLLLAQQQVHVDKITAKPTFVTWLGHRTAVVNSGMHVSEVGAQLLRNWDIDVAMMYFDVISEAGDRVRVHSLRSRTVRVNDIAKAYGGGGHPQAASFRTHIGEFFV